MSTQIKSAQHRSKVPCGSSCGSYRKQHYCYVKWESAYQSNMFSLLRTSSSLQVLEKCKAMPLENRTELVKKNKLCYNCLNTGHRSSGCKLNKVCSVCQGKHSPLLHIPVSDISQASISRELIKEVSRDRCLAGHTFEVNSDVSVRTCLPILLVIVRTLIMVVSSKLMLWSIRGPRIRSAAKALRVTLL